MKVFRIVLKIVGGIFFFSFLTILTQVGGIAYLLNFSLRGLIHRITPNKYLRFSLKTFSFLLLYSLISFVITPMIAKPLGRVAMPVTSEIFIRPANLWTCILNRHYVTPQLRDVTLRVCRKTYERYPASIASYLDAGFPFGFGIPMLPHLSHGDGRKIDFAFFYNRVTDQKPTHELPSWIGYGSYETPLPGEVNTPKECAEKGEWKYNLLNFIAPQDTPAVLKVNAVKTAKFIEYFALEEGVEKIFLEPYLKTRWGLTSPKIRFHGCHSIRHDDHVHIQVK